MPCLSAADLTRYTLGMAVLLSCRVLSKSYGARPLFSNITFGIDDGERLGLIGPNGSGKSTLLKILAGQETPDEGTTSARRGLRIGYVAQDENFDGGQAVEAVLTAAVETGDAAEKSLQVDIMLARMEFADRTQAVETLSGGWQKRLALAVALLGQPDVLLLDEPTNHLDLEGVLWLENLLQNAPFAFVVVSHDRQFLENVAAKTMELSAAYAEGFLSVNGPYSDFLQAREDYLAAQSHRQHALQGQVKREIAWLRRGPQARTTKAQSRIDSAGKLIGELAEVKARVAAASQTAGVEFSASGRQTRDLVVAKTITKSLGGRRLFADLDVTLAPRQKLGVIGANGSGKTTLLRLFAGELEPDSGTIKRADGLRVVRFDQSRAALDLSLTLRQALSPDGDTVVYRGQPMHVSAWARRFLFSTEQLPARLSLLSGGEQARVLIAQLMLQPADLLILDEPTNDLDIPTLEVLEDSLADFPGALVLVTHDRYLLDTLSTELLALDGRGGARFFADLSQWEAAQKPATPPPAAAKPKIDSLPRLSTSERRELAQMEGKIEAAEQAVGECKASMHDPKIASDAAKLHEAWEKLPVLEADVVRLYARWEELESRQS